MPVDRLDIGELELGGAPTQVVRLERRLVMKEQAVHPQTWSWSAAASAAAERRV